MAVKAVAEVASRNNNGVDVIFMVVVVVMVVGGRKKIRRSNDMFIGRCTAERFVGVVAHLFRCVCWSNFWRRFV